MGKYVSCPRIKGERTQSGLFGGLLAALLLGFVFVMLLDRLLGGRHGGADEALAVVAPPVVGLFALDVGPVDDRRHVALPEVVGLLGRLEVRPVVRELEEGAELALLLLQAA